MASTFSTFSGKCRHVHPPKNIINSPTSIKITLAEGLVQPCPASDPAHHTWIADKPLLLCTSRCLNCSSTEPKCSQLIDLVTSGARSQGQQSAAGSEQSLFRLPSHGDSHAFTLSRLLEKLAQRLNRCCGVLTPPPAAPPPLHTLFNNYQQMIFARVGGSFTES